MAIIRNFFYYETKILETKQTKKDKEKIYSAHKLNEIYVEYRVDFEQQKKRGTVFRVSYCERFLQELTKIYVALDKKYLSDSGLLSQRGSD